MPLYCNKSFVGVALHLSSIDGDSPRTCKFGFCKNIFCLTAPFHSSSKMKIDQFSLSCIHFINICQPFWDSNKSFLFDEPKTKNPPFTLGHFLWSSSLTYCFKKSEENFQIQRKKRKKNKKEKKERKGSKRSSLSSKESTKKSRQPKIDQVSKGCLKLLSGQTQKLAIRLWIFNHS